MRSPKVIAVCAALLAATVLAGEPFAASPRERLKAKAAQAQQVLQQVNALDTRFGQTVEAWNGARYELDKTRRQLVSDHAALQMAKRQQRIAIAHVKARLIALYESSDDPTTISVLFGSSTLSDLLGRLDAAQTISTADHNARVRYAAAERRTRALEQRRAVAVEQLTSQRQRIESMLGQRRQLLSSIQSQIVTLKAQEARRQAILAQEARARLAREQEALRQQAAARAAAARRAALPAPAAPAAAAAPAVTSPAVATPAAPAAPTPAPATAPPAAAIPAPSNLVGGHPEAASIAMRYLGVPYVWGGASPSGFDCSGLVMYVFAQLGISLPHYAAAQYGYGTPVPADQLQPGDLVFFDGLGHVGIYIGGGQMIHAPHTGDVVKISPISEFGSAYVGARRL
jgi:cell wall-associated NlpC family hydrolase/regulator of replication initiation timing